MPPSTHEPNAYHARIDPTGRLTIPSELRQLEGLHTGDEVVIVRHAGRLEIRSYEQALWDAQELVCRAIPASRSLSDELIAERRLDAIDD